MRDIFNWDRTTVNFFRYVSTSTVPSTAPIWAGRHIVVYIPRDGRVDPPFLEKEFIVSHMLPRELQLKPYGEPEAERVPPGTYEAQIDDVRKIGEKQIAVTFKTFPEARVPFGQSIYKQALHALNYSDPNSPPFRDLRGNRIFIGKTLEERVANLEWLMGMAYRALEKLIGWYYKAKRRR